MKLQDKQAEIALSEQYLADGSWEDYDSHLKARRKQLLLLQPFLSQNQLVLDAGCGPGTYGIILAEKNDVVGVDLSSKIASTSKQRASEGNVRFWPLVGDLDRLPFKKSSFDICFCGFTLHHFPNTCDAIGELIRVTKPGGIIALLEPNGSNPGVRFSNIVENLISRQLVKYGLETPNETIHNHRHYVKALEQQGVANICVTPHYFGGLPPLPRKSQKGGLGLSIVYFVVNLRRLVYILMVKILPQPLNGAALLITGTKK